MAGVPGPMASWPDTSSESPGWPTTVKSAAGVPIPPVFGGTRSALGQQQRPSSLRGVGWACFYQCGPRAEQWEGLIAVSETYTAVYERDGEQWAVRIAEEPDVQILCPTVPAARQSIRDALARWLGTDSAQLRIVDNFPLPAPIRTAQQSVKATRTDDDRTQMMAKMTDPRSAMDWAEDLGIAMRDPVTVQALMDLGDKPISVDTFCHTITMAEELSRLNATADRRSQDAVVDGD
jgi:hypothetical protein